MSFGETGHPGHQKAMSKYHTKIYFAFVEKAYFDYENRLRIDCEDPVNVGFWKGVLVNCVGGGGETSQHPQCFVPIAVSSTGDWDLGPGTQAVLLRRAPQEMPVCIGFINHHKQETVKEREEVAQDEDHPTIPTPNDWCWVQSGGRLMLSGNGSVVMDMREATDPNVRAQLGPNGVFRVSRDGDASERPVLAGPLLEYLGRLEAYAANLEARLLKLEALPPSEISAAAALGAPGVTLGTLSTSATDAALAAQPDASISGLRSVAVHLPSHAED